MTGLALNSYGFDRALEALVFHGLKCEVAVEKIQLFQCMCKLSRLIKFKHAG